MMVTGAALDLAVVEARAEPLPKREVGQATFQGHFGLLDLFRQHGHVVVDAAFCNGEGVALHGQAAALCEPGSHIIAELDAESGNPRPSCWSRQQPG